jgi:hypothetical protein
MRYALLFLLCVSPLYAQNQGPQRGVAQDQEARERKLQRCMVDLRNMPDGEFKRWCLAQSKRLP